MDPSGDPHLLLQLFRERDTYLFFALFVIGGLYWLAANVEARIEEYHRANPGAKQMYDAWQREQRLLLSRTKKAAAIYCPLHRKLRDECGDQHLDEEEP